MPRTQTSRSRSRFHRHNSRGKRRAAWRSRSGRSSRVDRRPPCRSRSGRRKRENVRPASRARSKPRTRRERGKGNMMYCASRPLHGFEIFDRSLVSISSSPERSQPRTDSTCASKHVDRNAGELNVKMEPQEAEDPPKQGFAQNKSLLAATPLDQERVDDPPIFEEHGGLMKKQRGDAYLPQESISQEQRSASEQDPTSPLKFDGYESTDGGFLKMDEYEAVDAGQNPGSAGENVNLDTPSVTNEAPVSAQQEVAEGQATHQNEHADGVENQEAPPQNADLEGSSKEKGASLFVQEAAKEVQRESIDGNEKPVAVDSASLNGVPSSVQGEVEVSQKTEQDDYMCGEDKLEFAERSTSFEDVLGEGDETQKADQGEVTDRNENPDAETERAGSEAPSSMEKDDSSFMQEVQGAQSIDQVEYAGGIENKDITEQGASFKGLPAETILPSVESGSSQVCSIEPDPTSPLKWDVYGYDPMGRGSESARVEKDLSSAMEEGAVNQVQKSNGGSQVESVEQEDSAALVNDGYECRNGAEEAELALPTHSSKAPLVDKDLCSDVCEDFLRVDQCKSGDGEGMVQEQLDDNVSQLPSEVQPHLAATSLTQQQTSKTNEHKCIGEEAEKPERAPEQQDNERCGASFEEEVTADNKSASNEGLCESPVGDLVEDIGSPSGTSPKGGALALGSGLLAYFRRATKTNSDTVEPSSS